MAASKGEGDQVRLNCLCVWQQLIKGHSVYAQRMPKKAKLVSYLASYPQQSCSQLVLRVLGTRLERKNMLTLFFLPKQLL